MFLPPIHNLQVLFHIQLRICLLLSNSLPSFPYLFSASILIILDIFPLLCAAAPQTSLDYLKPISMRYQSMSND